MHALLKAGYFPNTFVMNADLGNNPSYTWRGIWEARWVVKRGLCWRIGNGESVRIWKDPSISESHSHKVISPRGEFAKNLDVCSLIHPIFRAWDRALLSEMFLSFKQERILRIPLSSRFLPDKLSWSLDKFGEYTVKSAYKIIFFDVARNNDASCSYTSSLWNKVWSAPMLPRVKVFA